MTDHTGDYPHLSNEEVVEAFSMGTRGASAGINSALWCTCMVCGACVIEVEYGPPVNRRRHLRWHDEQQAALSGSSEAPGG